MGREIYIIIEGTVEVKYTAHDDGGNRRLTNGNTFGEGCASELFDTSDAGEAALSRAASMASFKPIEVYKREDSAVAASDCELKFLTLANLREVCADYPSVRAEMWLLVQVRAQLCCTYRS